MCIVLYRVGMIARQVGWGLLVPTSSFPFLSSPRVPRGGGGKSAIVKRHPSLPHVFDQRLELAVEALALWFLVVHRGNLCRLRPLRDGSANLRRRVFVRQIGQRSPHRLLVGARGGQDLLSSLSSLSSSRRSSEWDGFWGRQRETERTERVHENRVSFEGEGSSHRITRVRYGTVRYGTVRGVGRGGGGDVTE